MRMARGALVVVARALLPLLAVVMVFGTSPGFEGGEDPAQAQAGRVTGRGPAPKVDALAQTGPSAQVTNVDGEGWPKVTAAVTVLDASGRPATGLGADAFSGEIGGTALGVTGVTPASAPGIGIAVVFTFDTSGSMAGAPLDSAKAAAKSLVGQIGAEDQAAIVSFSDAVRTVQGFTGDKAALNAAIDSLTAAGNTSLYSAVEDSIALAGTAPLPRRSVILLSDGVDFGGVSDVDANSTLTQAEQSDAIVFTIGLGPDVDEGYLSELAKRGRGQYLRAPTPEQLASVYETAGSILRNQYIVAFDASDVDTGAAAGQPLVVKVSVGGKTVTSEAAVTLPTAETPPPTEAPTASPAPTAAPGPVEEDSGGGFPVAIAAAAAGVAGTFLLFGAGTLLFRRWRRRRRTRMQETDIRRFRQTNAAPVIQEITRAVEPDKALAYLTLPDGIKKSLGMSPVTIGFTSDCTVQLPDGGPMSMERVRVWWRDGNFMLHNLSRTGRVMVGGKPATWVVLEDGDEIEIGGSRVSFSNSE